MSEAEELKVLAARYAGALERFNREGVSDDLIEDRNRLHTAIDAQQSIIDEQRAEIERLTKDAERLAYIYSGQRTTSDALVTLELKLLHGEAVTMDEVRTAIDAAIAAGSKTELEGGV